MQGTAAACKLLLSPREDGPRVPLTLSVDTVCHPPGSAKGWPWAGLCLVPKNFLLAFLIWAALETDTTVE